MNILGIIASGYRETLAEKDHGSIPQCLASYGIIPLFFS
jgi:hypothetical protein